MAPHEPPSWALARLISWRTRLLAGAVLVCALFLDVLVLGVGGGLDGAAAVATTPASSAPEPSTVVVGIGATARPIPSVPATTPLVVADVTTTTVAPAVVVLPLAGSAPAAVPAPAIAAPVAPAPAPPAAATPVARTPSPAAPTAAAPPPTAGTTTPTTLPKATTSVPGTVVASTSPTTVPTTTTTAVPVAAPIEYVTYTASSGAGDVVLAVAADSITLYGFYANPNWISQTEQNGPRTVKLKFFNTSTKRDAEWTATRDGGRIKVEN